MVNKKVTAIIQARYNSVRFPGKILKKINNVTVLEILIKRLSQSKLIKEIIVSCSNNPKDKKIIYLCKKLNINYYVGPEKNLLSRYYKTAKKFHVGNILRITGDCPLIDSKLIDRLIGNFFDNDCDYASNVINPTFPDGLDIEVFKFKILSERYKKSTDKFEKEHVTTNFINNDKYKRYSLELKKNYANLRITLDTEYDFYIINKLFEYFKYDFFISYKKILNLYEKNPSFFEKNYSVKRNIGMKLNKGQKYWIRAKNIIPGGTMLFSKNPDLQLPNLWPAYFSKARGSNLWDLDGNKYDDMFSMGIGTNTLGYSNIFINNKVKKVINDGNMSSLNSIDEILLAEKLVEMHPWANMVRFTRSGGEANSVAVRIARASSGRDKIAICGYHGWHDWYLSANLNNKSNLDQHLLKNLNINGVPKNLKNTTFPFKFNDFKSLEKIIKKEKIGVIKMEVHRSEIPNPIFLKKVRDIATKKNIVLIFDECTSGFRETYGGIHLKYKIFPDIAIFGKALGNGYAINAIIGKKEIMESCQSTFISSTFWTERVGSVAALETLKIMEKIQSWKQLISIGKKIKKNWSEIAKTNSLKINITGLDALPSFYFDANLNTAYKTYITQELLKKNILGSNVVYTSVTHKKNILDKYFRVLKNIFTTISECENEKNNIYNLLETEEAISGLRYKKNV